MKNLKKLSEREKKTMTSRMLKIKQGYQFSRPNYISVDGHWMKGSITAFYDQAKDCFCWFTENRLFENEKGIFSEEKIKEFLLDLTSQFSCKKKATDSC